MKKLLVLSVMLALASSASAAVIDVNVNGQDWDGSSVKPSDMVRITMSEDVGLPGGFGDFRIGVSHGDPVSADMIAQFTIIPGSIITTELANGGIDYAMYGMSFPNSPTGDLFVIEFHVPDVPDSTWIEIGHTMGSWNGNFRAFEPVLMHVPEPMTLALLGLGGLGMLRRRRA